jgi:thiamine-monophosphate kinase
MVGEFDRIARYFAPLAAAPSLGLTDDAACLRPDPARDQIITVDQMLEGVHFLADDPPDLIARKLLRRNLSDLAAMGATPLHYLLTTALRVDTPEPWLAQFAQGLAEDQARYHVTLIGGDSTSTPGPLAFSITMIGTIQPGSVLRRSGAQSGDAIFVTGTIGDAALGLAAARGECPDPTGFFRTRRLLPEPRLNLPIHAIAHAAIDVSDGLLQDLMHLCTQSNLAAAIHAHAVPASPAAAACGPDALMRRLTGGDDYELILAAPPGAQAALCQACAPTPITRIGHFAPGVPRISLLDDPPLTLPDDLGWNHF